MVTVPWGGAIINLLEEDGFSAFWLRSSGIYWKTSTCRLAVRCYGCFYVNKMLIFAPSEDLAHSGKEELPEGRGVLSEQRGGSFKRLPDTGLDSCSHRRGRRPPGCQGRQCKCRGHTPDCGLRPLEPH